MTVFRFLALFLLQVFLANGQEKASVSGRVLHERTNLPVAEALIVLEDTTLTGATDANGYFTLPIATKKEAILNISRQDFVTKRIPVYVDAGGLDLGTIFLAPDLVVEQVDNLITLTDAELFDDEASTNASGLLQATRDVFLARAAFDFGQAFFRVRGYDAQYGNVMLNGMPMNKFFDGRPQWNNWGGLNDVTRKQQFTLGLQPFEFGFGAVLGSTNIDLRPSGLRPGARFSTSVSNRTYTGRLMASYSSGLQKNGLAYTFSVSRRWAKEGYVAGTLYDAFSMFAALEYRLNTQHALHFTGILAADRRGRSAAITEEVFDLVGNTYNPYWGEQGGKARNSRERKIAEPILMLNHYFETDSFNLNTAVAYQFGGKGNSRLGYFNAPNPDPTYYRYLPSFYLNSPIGANFTSANTAKEGFLSDPQLDWNAIYTANRAPAQNGLASYVYYDDVTEDKLLSANTLGSLVLANAMKIQFGVHVQHLNSANYAKIIDLLGADFHRDIDPFSNTKNNVSGEIDRSEDDIFNYNYRLVATKFNAFAQFMYKFGQFEVFAATDFAVQTNQREGFFQNERFPQNSLGKSELAKFINYGFKGGITYAINGRHSVIFNGAVLGRPPLVQNMFINPRENNLLVPQATNERITAADINYYLRLPKVSGRFTAYHTRFQGVTDINFFFVDAGVGSDFVQEVVTDLDKLHVGAEIGVEYQASPSVQLSAVAALGNFVYASDPNIAINFDTAGNPEELIDLKGNLDLGTAKIKGLKLAQGPQTAVALGINYRDPKYWWIGATANFLADNYINISTIARTPSFLLDPSTGMKFENATEANVSRLLSQQALENVYLLNLVGGKSWLKNGKYVSLFIGINNLFDTIFKSGGYEQGRNGNFGQLQQDNLSGSPSFAPKYWHGYGRTYFLNLAYSF